MMNEPALTIKNLMVRFGEVAVLRGVSASLPSGAVTAFVGPNGAGKTTLFHAISGDLLPDKGIVSLRGKPITGMAPWKVARNGLGKMFQDVRVFDSLTVIDNVLLALHEHEGLSVWASLTGVPMWRRHAPKLLQEAESWLEIVGVERPYDRPAGLLSFGNKKLLALARLMAGKFDVFLLDEPTAGVSPVLVERIAELIRKMANRGITIALIEHNFSFVTNVAEHVYLMREGTIQDWGATEEVLAKDENREILIGL
ncbi:MAG: ATP-binding cassette domain-containing protein [Methylococcales bacterium]|nr:ATP-binding cassette domain-containing protein [Methylococcales bacterium]